MSIIDDYADIARRMKRSPSQASAEEDGEAVCRLCEGGGWTLSVYQAVGAPNFEECPHCHNPEGHPCP